VLAVPFVRGTRRGERRENTLSKEGGEGPKLLRTLVINGVTIREIKKFQVFAVAYQI
jgi:hypothetical protein